MNDYQRILQQIKEMQALAEELGLENVVAALRTVLDSYSEDVRSLARIESGAHSELLAKPITQRVNIYENRSSK